jgi:hypothetical protein
MATDEQQPAQIEVERVVRRYDLAKSVVPAIWIASFWVPLQGALPIAKALAGEHTEVAITLSISIVFSVALGAGVLSLLRRLKEQRKEMLRLRRRCSNLEEELKSFEAVP